MIFYIKLKNSLCRILEVTKHYPSIFDFLLLISFGCIIYLPFSLSSPNPYIGSFIVLFFTILSLFYIHLKNKYKKGSLSFNYSIYKIPVSGEEYKVIE